MGKRGEQLREHILYAAKEVFLEMGFERASMDVISVRAKTSKRTLYAHFENKENLYLAVVELSRRLYLLRLRHPADYADTPEEALVLFCGRFQETLLYAPLVGMCRVSIAEAERFPEGAAQYFDVMFSEAEARLRAYLEEMLELSPQVSATAVQELLGRVTYPVFPRALFGLEKTFAKLPDTLSADYDLQPIRNAVAQLLHSLKTTPLEN